MVTETFEYIVREFIDPLLVPLGFVRRPELFERKLREFLWEVQVGLTCDRGKQHGSFGINIGVGYKPVTKFLLSCPTFEKRRRVRGIFGANLSGLSGIPTHGGWMLDTESNADVIGREVAEAITTYVLPALGRFTTPQSIIDILEQDEGSDPYIGWERIYPLVAFRWLQGNKELAIHLAESNVEELSAEAIREPSGGNRLQLAWSQEFLAFLKDEKGQL
jgi:hypothetical protein